MDKGECNHIRSWDKAGQNHKNIHISSHYFTLYKKIDNVSSIRDFESSIHDSNCSFLDFGSSIHYSDCSIHDFGSSIHDSDCSFLDFASLSVAYVSTKK